MGHITPGSVFLGALGELEWDFVWIFAKHEPEALK